MKKKLKVVIAVVTLGLLITGSAAIYLAVVGIRHLAQFASSDEVSRQAEVLKSKAQSLTEVDQQACARIALSVLSLDNLLSTPIKENFQSLKRACFESRPQPPESGQESESI